MRMKKLTVLLLAMVLLLCACAGTSDPPETGRRETETTSVSRTPEASETNPQSAATTEPSAEGTETHILVACFSATGNTKPLAEAVARLLDADLYEIVPEEPYTEEDLAYYTDCRADREQNDPDCRPAIAGQVENMAQYDTVVIGHPIWHGQAPRIISTFLESYDFSGKTLTTFCTSHSSPLGTSAQNLYGLVPDSVTWLPSRRFAIGTQEDELAAWLLEIGLLQPEETEEPTLKLTVNGTEIDVLWEDNESAAALKELVAEGPLTIQMSPYGGFEQVGPIGQSIPRNDVQTVTEPGDLVLYSGNQIVVFYGSNSWAYTRLGKIQGMDQAALTELLGNGAVTLTLSLGAETAEHRIPDVLLNSGYTMPVIGLGTWSLNDEEAENSVYHALKCGMRLIDTARYYGNEVGVGRGLQRAIDEGIVTREEVFLTSKIYGGNYERAGGIIDSALSDLNVDYIDLLLIHQPGSDDEGVYKAMEEAVEAGKLRSIGISNYYTPEAVDEVLAFAEIVPAVIQNENHLYYQNAALQEYVKEYGIVVESWYPFGGRGHTQEHFNNEVILDLAQKYGKSAAQIILRWHVQAGYIAIPGSSNPDHIAENYDIFDFCLTEEEMQRIYALDEQERYENW